MSTDTAHSLGDTLGVVVDGEPTEVGERLHAQQVDTQRRFEQSWSEIQRYLLTVLDAAGVDPITAEELTVLPGAEEVLALLELRAQVRSGRWDVVVVDCAPTAETLRLLALPEALGWYMERILPAERRLVRTLRPVLTRAAGVPMPADPVFDAVERLHADLAEVQQILTDPATSVRVVLTPEAVVLAEARRSLTTLTMFGYRVDGVVANRVFPTDGADPWRQGWVDAQQRVLAEVATSFDGVPVWHAPFLPEEPVGVAALTAAAEQAYAGDDPLAIAERAEPLTVRRTPHGMVLRLELPFVDKDDVDLARHGDELVVTVGTYRRVLALPAALRHRPVLGARVDGGALVVRFGDVEERHG
jgi:arsenite-transporting ATPase